MVGLVLILISICLLVTVILTVYEMEKLKEEVKELKKAVRFVEKEIMEVNTDKSKIKGDVEALASAINIYNTAIQGNVKEQVKENIDLFSEWINGASDDE